MARKKQIYTHLFPYHVYARTNNKEWFDLSMNQCWDIFCEKLNKVQEKFNLKVHAFVLMHNHYHLICSTSEKYNLGQVMSWLQRETSKKISKESNKINHFYGSPYKSNLIISELHYATLFKYVLNNPVRAQLVVGAEEYNFSTLNLKNKIKTSKVNNGIDVLIPPSRKNLINFINSGFKEEFIIKIKSALKHREFEL